MPTTKAVIQIPEEDLVPVERGHEPDRKGSSPVGPEGTAQSTIGSHSAALSAGNGEGTTQIEAPRQRRGSRSNRILKARNGRPAAENGNAEKTQPGAPARLSVAGPDSHPTEVELKLLVEPDQLGRLNDAPVIAGYARNKGIVRLLKDTYYDTPAGALRGAGVTLRVRQCGKRFVQTMKLAPAEGDLALRRGEWETPVAGIAPDFRAVTPLISMGLQEALAHEPLEPVFATEVRRRLRTLTLPSGTVEVAFDSGVLKSGERTAPVCEIEIELKSGGPAALYDLALLLAEQAAVRPTTRTKAERGLELALETAPAVYWPSKLPLGDEVSLDDAFAQLLRSALQQLVRNQPAAEDGRDPEGIHQSRIALRRLRCALTLLRSLAPSATLASLRATGMYFSTRLWRKWRVPAARLRASI